MATLTHLLWALTPLLTPITTATTTTNPNCCNFTLSTPTGPFSCPAGELLDGQIRLNGTYPPSTFCIDPTAGTITNARHFGCIVTEPPTTQFQCDEGKPPTPGFSIGANNTLLYQNSSRFYVCPATDTEYNIYIDPDFGQEKCFPVVLQTDGCGTESCPAVGPRETVWMTEWATRTERYMITETWTSLVGCSTGEGVPTGKPTGRPPCKGGKGGCQQGNGTAPSTGGPVWTNDTFAVPVPVRTGAGGEGTGVVVPPGVTSVVSVGGPGETGVAGEGVGRRWWGRG
ncbi:hypothetical protein QBC34DRAFT_313278 [Podospora aff. communis PSN243]|uniref:Cell wall mannoprotein PIR1-like C-terminal domain-containing protein n=1 Tax=Podospora aff. communis PSN243 TaxID=3040156 RepID=A0AAV9FYX5_9PEZI|nr:hypothetical protein QBC34DRAFT_313278 [Podospora aff. communis PSN243]